MTRTLAFALATAAVVLLIMGTGGFSTVTADRNANVAVVDDEHAYLGIQTHAREGTVHGEPVTILELTDQFPENVWLDEVHLIDNPSFVTLETSADGDPTIGNAESDPLPVNVTCLDPGHRSLGVNVNAKGSDTTADVTREVGIECTLPDVDAVVEVTFAGCGNAHTVTAKQEHYPIYVTKVIKSSDGLERETKVLRSDGNVQGSEGGRLIALDIALRENSNTVRFPNPNTCADAGNPTSNESENGVGNQ